MSLTENTVKAGKWNWFYRESQPRNASDRPTVVLLHGIPAHSLMWGDIMPILAEKGFHSIAPDWLGCGFSDKPEKGEFSYTPDSYQQELQRFLDCLSLDKISLVVQGFLAHIGILYALNHPEQVDRLIILNTPISTNHDLPWQMRQWGFPFMGDMLTQDPLLVDRTLEGGTGFVIADKNLDIYRKPFLKSSDVGRALVYIIKQMKLSQSLEKIETGLKETTIPTRFIWGMADAWLDGEEAEKLAKTNPHLDFVKFAEFKHYPQEHFSKELSGSIISLLNP